MIMLAKHTECSNPDLNPNPDPDPDPSSPLSAQVTTLASLNDALAPINMAVTGAEEGPVAQVEWSVRDGRSLYRFTDDMVRLQA